MTSHEQPNVMQGREAIHPPSGEGVVTPSNEVQTKYPQQNSLQCTDKYSVLNLMLVVLYHLMGIK